MTFAGRIEALVTVPSGVSSSATNSGGGPTSVAHTAGDYYLTAAGTVASLIDTLKADLNTGAPPAGGSWDVSFDPSLGLVTIDCTSGGTLTKTGGIDGTRDAGANTQAIAGNGFIEVTIDGSNARIDFGLSAPNTGVDRDSGYFFEFVDGGDLWVRELGHDKGSKGTWAAGDTFRVRRTGTAITYEKNGTVVYTSADSVSGSLVGDFSFMYSGTVVRGVRLYDGTSAAYQALVWSNVTNVTAASETFSLAFDATLRSLLGFVGDIGGANTPQTGTKQARGLWRPNAPLLVETYTAFAPPATDARQCEGPTGKMYTFVGNSKYRHRNLQWQLVPLDRVREASATYANASLEQFWKDTQVGLGGISWLQPGALVQVYDHSGVLLGLDANDGAGTDGWQLKGIDSFDDVVKRVHEKGWNGLWRVTFPELVSSG